MSEYGNYPMPDYLGAARTITNQWSDINRVDRENQNRDIQQSNLESMRLNREVHQSQLDDYKRKRKVAESIGMMIRENGVPEDGDIGPQLGKMAVRAFELDPEAGMALATQYKAWKAEDRQSMKDQREMALSILKINREAGVNVFKGLKAKYPNEPYLSALDPDSLLKHEGGPIVYPAQTPNREPIDGLFITIDPDTGKQKLTYIKPEVKKPPSTIGYNEGDQHVTEIYENGEKVRTIRAPRYKPEKEGGGSGMKPPSLNDRRQTASKVASLMKDPNSYDPPEGGWPIRGKIDPRGMRLKLREDIRDDINTMLGDAGMGGLEEKEHKMTESRGIGGWRTKSKPAQSEYSYSRRESADRGDSPSVTQVKGGKTLDAATAQKFFDAAGGDKNRARQMARDAGYKF